MTARRETFLLTGRQEAFGLTAQRLHKVSSDESSWLKQPTVQKRASTRSLRHGSDTVESKLWSSSVNVFVHQMSLQDIRLFDRRLKLFMRIWQKHSDVSAQEPKILPTDLILSDWEEDEMLLFVCYTYISSSSSSSSPELISITGAESDTSSVSTLDFHVSETSLS